MVVSGRGKDGVQWWQQWQRGWLSLQSQVRTTEGRRDCDLCYPLLLPSESGFGSDTMREAGNVIMKIRSKGVVPLSFPFVGYCGDIVI